jgi:hypothetical protein
MASNPVFPATGANTAATIQLNLYNAALRLCGGTRIASLSDTQEGRLLLDDVWNDGALQTCLEEGLWYFARRTAKLTYDAAINPNFGYACAFEKPTDWVRTMGVTSDEMFEVPLTQVSDEGGYLYANSQVIYFAYVSNDPLYGGNLARWPNTFYLLVAAFMAKEIVHKLTGGDKLKIALIEKEHKNRLTDARSKAAMNESAVFLPVGGWVRARTGGRSGTDRGNLNSFYG